MKSFPFVQADGNKRIFSSECNEEDLIWHRDREDRKITVLSAGGWLFQFENQLPISLSKGQEIFIKKGEYHRIIKGDGNLVISVKKENQTERSVRAERFIEILNKL